MVSVASPSFIATPQSRVAIVDARNVQLPTIENVLVSKVSDFLTGIGLSIRDSQTMTSAIGSALLSNKLSLDQAENRLRDVLGAARVDYDSIKSFIKPMVLNQLTGYNTSTNSLISTDNLKNQFQVINGDQVYNGNNDNFKYVKSVLNIANDAIGDATRMNVVDTGTRTATMVGVLNSLGTLGTTELIPQLITKLDKDMAFNVIKQSSSQILDNANVSTLTNLGQYVPYNALTINTPDAVNRVLRNYTVPDGLTSDQYTNEAARLKSVLTQLKPDWLYTVRDGTSVYNYSTLNTASDSAIMILSYDPEVASAIVAARPYRVMDLKTKLTNDYPLVAIDQAVPLNLINKPIEVYTNPLKTVGGVSNGNVTVLQTQYNPLP